MAEKVNFGSTPMDSKELDEREEATDALAGEQPEHFVEYCLACSDESMKANKEIRKIWDETWKAYNQKIDWSNKESWQSKVSTPKPFSAVQSAKGIIKKALQTPNYFEISGFNMAGQSAAEFIRAAVDFWGNDQHGAFQTTFADASEMGLITGQSMEIIPQWDQTKGLTFDIVEPWKIDRDPDARRRDPWSGMYWIHREWVDKWELLQDQKDGIYENIDKVGETLSSEDRDEQRKSEKRKSIIWDRNKFRKAVAVREFWGTVLDPKGNLLLPNSTFTVGGDQLIRKPRPVPFARMRWPGTTFSPFAHLTRFWGKGILEGVLTLWWLQCGLLSMHMDALNWAINKIKEVDPSMMKIPSSLDIVPGSILEKKAGAQGNIVTEVEMADTNIDVLPNLNWLSNEIESGSFVNQFIQGTSGTGSPRTKGEVEIKTQMALGMFDSIGTDIEFGAVNALWAAIETIVLYWGISETMPSADVVFDRFPMAKAFVSMDQNSKIEFLRGSSTIAVKGISAQLKKADSLDRLMAMMKRLETPMYSRYIKPYELVVSFTELMSIEKPTWLVTPEQAQQIDQAFAEAAADIPPTPVPGQPGTPQKTPGAKESGNPGLGDLTPGDNAGVEELKGA